MSKLSLELSKAEIDHLLAHLEANGQETATNYDWYYGNRKQFEIRHEKLKQKLRIARLKHKEEEGNAKSQRARSNGALGQGSCGITERYGRRITDRLIENGHIIVCDVPVVRRKIKTAR